MTNAELIDLFRNVERSNHPVCNGCPMKYTCDKNQITRCLFGTAADALEAAEQRIARLEDDLRNSTISNPERFKIYDYTVEDLLLFAEMCKRNDVQERDLKQAAWNLELAVRAVMNERQEIVKNTMDEITMRFTPNFEKAFEEMMPKLWREDENRDGLSHFGGEVNSDGES